jgi:hypothetical protein
LEGEMLCPIGLPPGCPGSAGNRKGDFRNPNDANFAFEIYYKLQIADQVADTPSLFWLHRPLGQYTIYYRPGTNESGSLSTLGYLVQVMFRF